MSRMRRLALILALLPTGAAADCPPVPDRDAELEALYEAVRAAPSESAARVHSNAMWQIWTDAPDERSQALLDEGMVAMRVADYATAYDALGRLVDYCPDYAEGWNQRAFVHFLTGAHDKALSDLERALAINPGHMGALTGIALTLMKLGRDEEAQERLREAVALNPWITERHLLKEPPGTEL